MQMDCACNAVAMHVHDALIHQVSMRIYPYAYPPIVDAACMHEQLMLYAYAPIVDAPSICMPIYFELLVALSINPRRKYLSASGCAGLHVLVWMSVDT